ncbi:nucleoside deaminase [Dethiothermospora halolimnae]|uniref:nucleoside deaminase n=1 Tax=Dethiothermospora halolimnae TaxID=3114390 RepID=UPI003CCC43A2
MDINMPEPTKLAFSQAWKSYCKGSRPIGAVIVDDKNNIVAKGRDKTYERKNIIGQISGNRIAHGGINAILKLNEYKYKNIRSYTIYLTMEPCIMCYGAILTSNIGTIKFIAGNRKSREMDFENKLFDKTKTNIFGPNKEFDFIQIVLLTDFILRNSNKAEKVLRGWKEECSEAVEIGIKFYKNDKLLDLRKKKKSIIHVIREINKEIS